MKNHAGVHYGIQRPEAIVPAIDSEIPHVPGRYSFSWPGNNAVPSWRRFAIGGRIEA
jgi:hypothetical protein